MQISPLEAFEQTNNGALFIDVRTEDGSEAVLFDCISFEQLSLLDLLENIETLPKNRLIITADFDGSEAYKAANLLINNGFENVKFLDGGMLAWKKSGLPLKFNISGECSHETNTCGGCECGC